MTTSTTRKASTEAVAKLASLWGASRLIVKGKSIEVVKTSKKAYTPKWNKAIPEGMIKVVNKKGQFALRKAKQIQTVIYEQLPAVVVTNKDKVTNLISSLATKLGFSNWNNIQLIDLAEMQVGTKGKEGKQLANLIACLVKMA